MDSLPPECVLEVFSWLDSPSLRQCSLVSSRWFALTRENILWRGLSVQRWGPAVLQYPGALSVSWFQYYRKRCCKAGWIRPSPLNLIQERYHREPWKLLISIILTSRTTTPQKHDIVRSFFARWPTPSHVIDGCEAAMAQEIHILGLQPQRILFAKYCCKGFLWTEWSEVKDLKGVGTLGNDSWRLFCGWEEGPPWQSLDIADCTVRSYHRWLLASHSSVRNTGKGRRHTPSKSVSNKQQSRVRVRKGASNAAMGPSTSPKEGSVYHGQVSKRPGLRPRLNAPPHLADPPASTAGRKRGCRREKLTSLRLSHDSVRHTGISKAVSTVQPVRRSLRYQSQT